MFVEPHVAVEVDRKAGDDADTEASDVSDAGSDSDDEPARLPGEAMVEAVDGAQDDGSFVTTASVTSTGLEGPEEGAADGSAADARSDVVRQDTSRLGFSPGPFRASARRGRKVRHRSALRKRSWTVRRMPDLRVPGGEERLDLGSYVACVVGIAAGVVGVATWFCFSRWPDGNGSPLKSMPGHVDLGSHFALTNELGDLAFRRYVAVVCATTCSITGLGSEVVLGVKLVAYISSDAGTVAWHFAQLLFSLFLTVAIMSQSAFGLPFLVFGLWKCGFPETIGYFIMARNIGFLNKRADERARAIACFLNGLGTLLHHNAGVWTVVCLVTHLAPFTRPILAPCLPLVVQHWMVLIKYHSQSTYVLVQLLLEVAWEFEVFANIRNVSNENGFDRVVRPAALVMLVSHWLYLLAALVDLLAPRLEAPRTDCDGDDVAAASEPGAAAAPNLRRRGGSKKRSSVETWKHHFEEARRPSVVVEDEAPPPRRDSKKRSSVETWKHHFEEARRPSSTAFAPGDEEPSLFVAPSAPHDAEPSPEVTRPPKSACSLFAPAEASDSGPN